MSTWATIWEWTKTLAIGAFLLWLAILMPGSMVDAFVTHFGDYQGNPDNLRWPAFGVFAVIVGFAIFARDNRNKERWARNEEIRKLKDELAVSRKRVMQLAFPPDADLDAPWLHPDTGSKGCPRCYGTGEQSTWPRETCKTCKGRGSATNKQAKLYLFSSP